MERLIDKAAPHGMKPSSRGGEADEAIQGPGRKSWIASLRSQ
jgi:hypothetical protein